MPSQFVSRVIQALRSFAVARRGNVSILFGFSLLPLIGLTGLGVDYGIAFSAKTRLDNAVDAAVLAAVVTAKAYVAANPTDANVNANAIAAGLDRAKRAFTVNAGAISFAAMPVPTLTLTRSGQTFASKGSYSTSTPAQFGRLFGKPSLSIAGSSAASADVPSYLDFYLLVDVSASMGLPSTAAGQNYLAANNGNCQFACHFPDQISGYNFAVGHNIQLRSGAVNTAVCGLLKLANAPTIEKQYRVGIYPFITRMATLAPISNNYSSLWTTATCDQSNPSAFTTLLDSGATQLSVNSDPSTGAGSGGTHFDAIMPSMQATVSPYGDGSLATNSKPFVFLITDGMQNSQFYGERQGSTVYYPGRSPYKSQTWQSYPDSWWLDGSSPSPMNASQCSALKSAGATISVLYIPYTTLTVTNQNTIETQQSNSAVPKIPGALQQCASAGYFYTANSPSDINDALAAMFMQATQAAHLTN